MKALHRLIDLRHYNIPMSFDSIDPECWLVAAADEPRVKGGETMRGAGHSAAAISSVSRSQRTSNLTGYFGGHSNSKHRLGHISSHQ